MVVCLMRSPRMSRPNLKALALAISMTLIAAPALAEPAAPAQKNPWLASGLSLGGTLAINAVAPPLAPLGLSAGYLYEGDFGKAVGVGIGGEGALLGGFLTGG